MGATLILLLQMGALPHSKIFEYGLYIQPILYITGFCSICALSMESSLRWQTKVYFLNYFGLPKWFKNLYTL